MVGAPPEWIDHGMSLAEEAGDRKGPQKDEEAEGSPEKERRSYDRRKQRSS